MNPVIRVTKLGRVLLPISIALLIGGAVIALSGDNPLLVYGLLLREAFGGLYQIQSTMSSSTVLLFTATATAISFRAGIFSLGAEGSLLAGGLAAAVTGSMLTFASPWIGIPVVLLVATASGVVAAVVPAVLRAWLDVDEVVTTLLFTFVVAGLVTWLVQSRFQAEGQANSATPYVQESVELPRFTFGPEVSLGFLIGILAVCAYAVWGYKTTSGYSARMLGASPQFAAATGIRTRWVILVVMLATGAVAGLGGGVHLSGLVHRYVDGFSAGYGFTGLAIVLLARFNPWGIIAGAIFFGAITSAGGTVQMFADIPLDIVQVLQGLVMIAVVADFTQLYWRRTSHRKRERNAEAVDA
jgi:simple sugar transport system permease protein